MKKTKSSDPEYEVQKQMETNLNQSYNTMLLAWSATVVKTVEKSIEENINQEQ